MIKIALRASTTKQSRISLSRHYEIYIYIWSWILKNASEKPADHHVSHSYEGILYCSFIIDPWSLWSSPAWYTPTAAVRCKYIHCIWKFLHDDENTQPQLYPVIWPRGLSCIRHICDHLPFAGPGTKSLRSARSPWNQGDSRSENT